MAPLLTDSSGNSVEVEEKKVSAKQLLFDYSGIVAIGVACIAWGVLSNSVGNNGREIDRLRAANELRAINDVRLAQDMATKQDVQRLSDQLQALALELRARAASK